MIINKCLVVVAHPDDEVLGAGGFIRKLSDEGKEVRVVFLNPGCNLRDGYDPESVKQQIVNSCQTLGVSNCSTGSFLTANFSTYPPTTLNDFVQTEIDEFKPDTVLTHTISDLHGDHKAVYNAVMVCCRFKPGSPVKNVLTFPVISSSDISPSWSFKPSLYVPLSHDLIMIKNSAMRFYKDEYDALISHRGESAIETWGKFFGLQCNSPYAECFKIIRATYE